MLLFSLGRQRSLALLVLCHLMGLALPTFLQNVRQLLGMFTVFTGAQKASLLTVAVP